MNDKKLATVAGVDITEKDFQEIVARYPQENRAQFETEAGKKQLLEQIIAFELMSKLGNELELNKTEEYTTALNKLSKDLLSQMTINKVLSEVTVTDKEVEEYYNNNKEMFKKQESVEAKHILVASEEEANKIKTEIESGEVTFEEAAKNNSTCPSKDNGGSLGAFGRGMMVPEFEEAAFKMPLNTVSEAVKTQFGYHLIMVTAKHEAEVQTLEEIKDNVTNMLLQKAQQEKYLGILKDLEGKYQVTRDI